MYRPHRFLHTATAAALLAGTTFAVASDWPQWRGPRRDGISAETGLLQEWPADGPALVWKVEGMGQGFSTPAVADDRVFLLGNTGNENEFVKALDAKDGKEVWTTRVGNVGNPDQRPSYPGARSTPTVDDAFVFALGSDGDLVCLLAASGKVRWQRSLRIDFGGSPGTWAYSESPLVDGDVVVCTPGGSEATLVALKKSTGDVIWEAAAPEGDQAGYASAIIAEIGGVKQYVQFVQKGVIGVEAKSGKILWRYAQTAEGSPANIPTPIAHDGYVYSGAGRSGGGLVKLKVEEGTFVPEQIYFTAKLPRGIGGSVRIGKYLYGTTGEGLLCADFVTGEVAWLERGVGTGSVCAADGRLYVHGESGEVALVDATPEAYREHGRFTPAGGPDRGRTKAWTYPVVAGGRLYVRDLDVLWCYDVKASE